MSDAGALIEGALVLLDRIVARVLDRYPQGDPDRVRADLRYPPTHFV